jgi:hypothetical protein
MNRFHIYCDERGHLERDHQSTMVLGALWCPAEKVRESAVRVREIKVKHGLAPGFEIKWTKVGPAKVAFYRDVMDYFFDDDDLHFRAVIIDKDRIHLDHMAFQSDHDTWYYKMFFVLLNPLFDPAARYRIFLDIKDTRSQEKVRKLHEVLCNSQHDFQREVIENVQQVRSHEVEHIQLADLLIGAVAYANRRSRDPSAGKQALVERMRQRSRYNLVQSTWLLESKVNLLRWEPRRQAE